MASIWTNFSSIQCPKKLDCSIRDESHVPSD